MMRSQKVIKAITPAKAGVQKCLFFLNSGFLRNDGKKCFSNFCHENTPPSPLSSPPQLGGEGMIFMRGGDRNLIMTFCRENTLVGAEFTSARGRT